MIAACRLPECGGLRIYFRGLMLVGRTAGNSECKVVAAVAGPNAIPLQTFRTPLRIPSRGLLVSCLLAGPT
jgi:hypothetical protein